jgi:ubiquinol-cytochrome c reductase core subunit 2
VETSKSYHGSFNANVNSSPCRPFFVELLTSFITSAKFARHEFQEYVIPVIESESNAASSDPAMHALELAHALAFRSGLGSSLFANPHHTVTVEDIKSFAMSAFSKGNVAVLGTGIDQTTLSKLVDKTLSSTPSAPALSSSPSTYFGGETRLESNGGLESIFIGYGVAGPSDPAIAALSAHLSPTPALKWSKGLSPLSDMPLGTSVQSVYLPYSDATLFGLLVQGTTTAGVKDAGKLAVKALKEAGGIKAEELKKALAKAKFAAASSVDCRDGIINILGPKVGWFLLLLPR